MPYHNMSTSGLSPVVESPNPNIKLTVDGSEWDLSNLMSPFADSENDNSSPVVEVKRIRRVRFQLDEDDEDAFDDDNTAVTNNTSKLSEDGNQRRMDPVLDQVHYPTEQEFPSCLDVDDIFSKLAANKMLSRGRLANPELPSNSDVPYEGYYHKVDEDVIGLSPRSTVTTPVTSRSQPLLSPGGSTTLFVDLDDAMTANSTLSSHSSVGRPYYGLDSPPPRSRRGEYYDREDERRRHYQNQPQQRYFGDDASQSSRGSSTRDDASQSSRSQSSRSQSSRSSSRRLTRGDRQLHYQQHRSDGYYDRETRYHQRRQQQYQQRQQYQQQSYRADREHFRRQNTRTYRNEEYEYHYQEEDRYYRGRQDDYRRRESPTRNHYPGEYDERCSHEDYEQGPHMQPAPRQRRRENRAPSLADTRTMVEIVPGEFVPLRGSGETWEAIQTGNVTRSTCTCCSLELMCIADADLVMCPGCRVISPVERGPGGGGLGLGMSVRDAQRELSQRR